MTTPGPRGRWRAKWCRKVGGKVTVSKKRSRGCDVVVTTCDLPAGWRKRVPEHLW